MNNLGLKALAVGLCLPLLGLLALQLTMDPPLAVADPVESDADDPISDSAGPVEPRRADGSSEAMRQSVLSRPLFSPSRQPIPVEQTLAEEARTGPEAGMLAQVAEPEEESEPQPEPPLPVLLGTTISNDNRIAVLAESAGQRPFFAREGAVVGPWLVTGVAEGAVFLRMGPVSRAIHLCFFPSDCE